MPKKVFCGVVTNAESDKTVKVSVLQVYKLRCIRIGYIKKLLKSTRSIQHMMRIIVAKREIGF